MAEVKPVEIITADNVTLTGTFYVAPKAGSPAVAMLHMAGGQRGDWDTLARQLQAAGFSVLTLDLRGHGRTFATHRDRSFLCRNRRQRPRRKLTYGTCQPRCHSPRRAHASLHSCAGPR